jgi:hypothetical protein
MWNMALFSLASLPLKTWSLMAAVLPFATRFVQQEWVDTANGAYHVNQHVFVC